MQVQIHFKDTMTGEDGFTLQFVNEFTGEAVRQAIENMAMSQTGESEGFALESWVYDKGNQTAVFILRELSKSAYGGYLLFGTASVHSS